MPSIQDLLERNPDFVFMQDNAPSHSSYITSRHLCARGIQYRTIPWPPYSPDLNIIEHIWNWMKNRIQRHYFQVCYRVDKIPLPQLRSIIWEAWNAIPDSYIEGLTNSWWSRCQAIIDARGGPTHY